MTLFFFVVGLEARREFDLGDLRDRRRLVLPFVAGIGGMIVPIAIFLAINAGGAPRGAWGTAMSTDTAFALGMLALVGARYPNSLRAFILTVAVVDDLVALLVIAVAFTSQVHVVALAVGITVFVLILVLRYRGVHNGGPYLLLGIAAWVAFLKSGIDPIVVGLAMGLLTIAYPAAREDLERATDLFRVFREQPTSELQQSARAGLRSAISPNERWQQMFHPFTSYVVVPLFALANAGFVISGSLPRPRLWVGDHDRHHRRLRRGQADRRHRGRGARHQVQPRAHPPAGGLGVGAGRRSDRRHRVHGVAADRVAGVHWRSPGGGQARRADHARGGAGRQLGDHLRHLPPAQGDQAAAAHRPRRGDRRPRRCRSTPSATTSAAQRRRT